MVGPKGLEWVGEASMRRPSFRAIRFEPELERRYRERQHPDRREVAMTAIGREPAGLRMGIEVTALANAASAVVATA